MAALLVSGGNAKTLKMFLVVDRTGHMAPGGRGREFTAYAAVTKHKKKKKKNGVLDTPPSHDDLTADSR